MKKIFLFTFLLFSVVFAFAQNKNGEKVVKIKSADIQWWGYKIVKSEATTHTGFVKLKNGRLFFKDKVLVGGEFLIDMRSLSNTDLQGEDQKKLTDDLKGMNFFDVKKYPTANFKITRIVPSKSTDYNYTIYGELYLKGVRKTISFPANIRKDDYVVVFNSAKFTLNRQHFKAFYKSSIKDYLIKDEMDLQVSFSTN